MRPQYISASVHDNHFNQGAVIKYFYDVLRQNWLRRGQVKRRSLKGS